MRLGFYAYDIGPGRMLTGQRGDVVNGGMGKGSLAEIAQTQGHDVIALPPQVRDVAMSRIEKLRNCDAVMFGLSSHETEQEIQVAEELSKAGVPVVIIEDVPGASLRPKAKDFAPKAALNIVAHPSGMEHARAFGYRDPLYVGPPAHWGQDYEAVIQAEKLRPTLQKNCGASANAVPFSPDDKLIYVEGGKGRPLIINNVIRSIRDASFDVLGDRLVFHFSGHPGERAETQEEKNLYDQAFEERSALLTERNISRLANSNLSSPQRVGLADVNIFASGGPTQSITGAYARLPMAYWNFSAMQGNDSQITAASPWFVAELGGMHVINDADPENLKRVIRLLLSPENQAALRARQEAAFTLPEQWDCRGQILELVKSL